MLSLLENVNLWAVFLAALVNFIMGSFWYSPLILGNPWMKEHGFTEADFVKGHSIWLIILLSFGLAFIAAFAIAKFIGPQADAFVGAKTGAIISLCWISTSRANLFLFEKHSFRLFMIHAGYDVLRYMVMGSIVGAWH